jgi:ribosome maturation factor RimP
LITETHIRQLADAALSGTRLYVTGVRVSPLNQITVFIDGDEGVRIEDCVALSRAIESQLDRDHNDFALDVSSHGAGSPLVMPRQYRRHVGRELDLKLENGDRVTGTLTGADESGLTVEWQEREPKPQGKGKVTVPKRRDVTFREIREGKIRLKF